jgi:hypothetical protein
MTGFFDIESELRELRWRHGLCELCIRMINGMDDLRKEAALVEYRSQLARIDAEITHWEKQRRMALGLPEPEPVVVGLKSAELFGRV